MSLPADFCTRAHNAAQDLIDFIEDSPSPWHAVQTASERLANKGYIQLKESESWQIRSGGRYFVVRGGASLIAFTIGQAAMQESGLRIIGAHTDSPSLRLKPNAAHAAEGFTRLGVEVYGSPILATYADRDLSLAGRVMVKNSQAKNGFDTRLLRLREPLVRLPNLAIHMNRDANENGLKFNRQTELPLLFGLLQPGLDSDTRFRQLLGETISAAPEDIVSWEITTYDTQKGSFWGEDKEFIASRQLDNLASCHAALSALLENESSMATCICALFDHEEVGSESSTGASGSFIADVLARLANNLGLDDEARRCAMAQSIFISADMAHAWNPNFPNAYEPAHRVMMNGGPVIKTNANQRYATTAETAARFVGWCEQAGVPVQQYAHRTDLACGSTIGPIVAANLGMATVDVGNPMWAMHSIRESAGAHDHAHMIAALKAAFSS